MVRDHRSVDVHRALRRAGRAAGEVDDRRVGGVGGWDLEVVAAASQEGSERLGSGRDVVAVSVYHEHVGEAGELVTDGQHPPPVQRRGRDQHPGVTQRHPLSHGLGSERGEERREHGARLPRADRGVVQLGNAAEQQEHGLAPPHAQLTERVGEAVRRAAQLGVGDGATAPVAPQPPQRLLIAPTAEDVSIDHLVRDVEAPAAREAAELGPRPVPRRRRGGGPDAHPTHPAAGVGPGTGA